MLVTNIAKQPFHCLQRKANLVQTQQ